MNKIIAPISDAIIMAVSKLVNDSQAETWREPSHSDIAFQIQQAGLAAVDPKFKGQVVGKTKRIREILNWAMLNDEMKGGQLIAGLIFCIRGCGGFRVDSPNYVGEDAIRTAMDSFAAEGFDLLIDGEFRPKMLENLSGISLTEALEKYVLRAKKGYADAALLAGTGKDLLEATAAHVIEMKYGSYEQANFPTLLGFAFNAVGLTATNGKTPLERLDQALYDAGCALNTLRNKEGTGHGRPWKSSLSEEDAKIALEVMGIIAERLLNKLKTPL